MVLWVWHKIILENERYGELTLTCLSLQHWSMQYLKGSFKCPNITQKWWLPRLRRMIYTNFLERSNNHEELWCLVEISTGNFLHLKKQVALTLLHVLFVTLKAYVFKSLASNTNVVIGNKDHLWFSIGKIPVIKVINDFSRLYMICIS